MTQSSRQKDSSGSSAAGSSVPTGVREAAEWSWRLLAIGALILAVLWLIVLLREISIPVLIAVLVAALLVPFSNFLQRHRWPRWASIAAALVSFIVALVGLVTLWVNQIALASSDLADRAQSAWRGLAHDLSDLGISVSATQLQTWIDEVVASIQNDSARWLAGALSVGTTLTHVLAGTLLVLFSTLFFLIDGRRIWLWIVQLFPRAAREAIDDAGSRGWLTLTSFVRVQILVAAIDGLGIGIGAALLGVPLAIPIGIMVFLGSFIPIVGAVVTGIIASIVALIYCGPVVALIMVGIVLLVQQVEGHVLQPLVMGSAVKVHPLAVVLAVATGSFLGGIAGALFAVPLAATLNVMVGSLVRRHPSAGVEAPVRSRSGFARWFSRGDAS
ncbi:MAG TPA: AI-2E family transporter [Microbacteriaceae bacterium]|nr:AI-2E family transporter [Microbacteriaceae bacterium]